MGGEIVMTVVTTRLMADKMATIIDGKAVAARLREDLAAEIKSRKLLPGLAVILVGDDPASHVYVRNKIRACAEVGIRVEIDPTPMAEVPGLGRLEPWRAGEGPGRRWALDAAEEGNLSVAAVSLLSRSEEHTSELQSH